MLILSVSPAEARWLKPKPVSCYFFRGEQVELKQTCIYEITFWSGGGVSSLIWEDGVKSNIAWGLQGRGEKICNDGEMNLDGVCGSVYYRHPSNLQRISQQDVGRMRENGEKVLSCVQVKLNSVCY